MPHLVGATALLLVVVFIAVINVNGYFRWIDTSTALDFRQPAVKRCEFDAWRELALEAARARPGNVDPVRWGATRDALNCR